MSLPAIRVTDLSKDFEIYDKPRDLAIELLTRQTRHRTFRALDKVSFEVEKGEVLGIIGSNGAGKSTLLKIITGVLDPTFGSVEVCGKVTAILELGLGFNMEYTGRKNIHLSALLYGMTQSEIDCKFAEIIDFCGLAEFIDLPIKTYSSGMLARLAFSIATAADPEVLIIDEALAAGDAMFVQKCLSRIRNFCDGGRTVLLVSHGTGLLAQLCKRVAWLDKGKLKVVGPALPVIQAYDLAAHAAADRKSWIEEIPVEPPSSTVSCQPSDSVVGASLGSTDDVTSHAICPDPPGVAVHNSPAESLLAGGGIPVGTIGRKALRRGPILIDSVELLGHNRQVTTVLTTMMPFTVQIAYHCEGELPSEYVGIAIAVNQESDLAPVMQWFTQNIRPNETRELYSAARFRKRAFRQGLIELKFDHVPFRAGTYVLSIGLMPSTPGNWQFWEYRHLFYKFRVEDGGLGVGAFVYLEPFCLHVDAAGEVRGAVNGQRPQPPTLGAEIRETCFGEGGYPKDWPRHERCPACLETTLLDSFSKDGFSHRRCGACEFVFMDPYPPVDVIRRLYSGHYYTAVRELFETPRMEMGEEATPYTVPPDQLDRIIARATRNRNTGTWLDVGGGVGSFARRIGKQHPGWTVELNEFNPRSVEIANAIFGVSATGSNAESLHAEDRTFDVISLIAVLEHIPLPRTTIEQYAKLLKPDGMFVIAIPNFTRLSRFVAQASSPTAGPPFHVSLFGADNLVGMLKATGLFSSIEILESGPAAFNLFQHVMVSDYFDVTTPTVSEPTPGTVMARPYEDVVGQQVAVLAEANAKLGDFFAETDGRLVLTALATRSLKAL